MSVLVENRPLVKFIRNYMRDLSSVFSIATGEDIDCIIFLSNCCLCTVCQMLRERWGAKNGLVKLSEAGIKSFLKEQENVNTKKKTLFDLKLFNKFFTSEDERREL